MWSLQPTIIITILTVAAHIHVDNVFLTARYFPTTFIDVSTSSSHTLVLVCTCSGSTLFSARTSTESLASSRSSIYRFSSPTARPRLLEPIIEISIATSYCLPTCFFAE